MHTLRIRPSAATVFVYLLCALFFVPAAFPCAGVDGPVAEEIGDLLHDPTDPTSPDPIYLVVDGQSITPADVPLFIKDGRTHGELNAIFTALGLDLEWDGPTQRITGIKNDLEFSMHLGCKTVDKDIYGLDAETITMDATPFVAIIDGVSTNRTVIPVSFAASATGAEVAWDNNTRTVTITSGRTWSMDWKQQPNGNYAGTYIHYTDTRYQEVMSCPSGFALEAVGPYGGRWCASATEAHGPFSQAMIDACGGSGACLNNTWSKGYAESLRGEGLCPAGSTFDTLLKYCVETVSGQDLAIGPFPQHYRNRCTAYASSTTCNADKWPTSIVQQITDTADLVASPSLSTQQVLDLFASHGEIYGVPLENNDLVSAGLYSPNGARDGNGNGGDYLRSEDTLPPFVLSGRRQTDSLARTAYLLLPASVRQSTAFLWADKVAQDPDAYLPYIQSKQGAVVLGTLMGPGGIKAKGDAKNQAVLLRQERELFKLRTTLALLASLGVSVNEVFYSIGDTVKLPETDGSGNPIPANIEANDEMDRIADVAQVRVDRILDAAGLSHLKRPLSFGGDELAQVAFAEALGVTYDVYVEIQDPTAKPRYDGGRTVEEIVNAKLAEAGLSRVYNPSAADMEVYVFSRQAGNTAMNTAADQAFIASINALSASRRAKTVILDARINNGALDTQAVPATCDFLTWTGWGTGGNNIGFGLAQGKILLHAKLQQQTGAAANARRLMLEAIAHDVYSNGYEQAQWGGLKTQIESVCGVDFVHHPGYTEDQADDVYCIFNQVTAYVSQKMLAKFPSPSCIPSGYSQPFKFTAQMWRTFESEVHMWPTVTETGEIFAPGVYREGNVPGATETMWHVLNPMGRGSAGATIVDLPYLVAE